MILIGSRALLFRAPELLNRQPKDFDFIATESEALAWLKDQGIDTYKYVNGKIIAEEVVPCEFELVQPGSSAEMLTDLVKKDPFSFLVQGFGLVPNLNLLFALKASHKYLKNSPYFWKTAVDYHKMKRVGASIVPEYMEFFKQREKETYTYAHPKLNVTKDNFFRDDGLKYVYDHDSIHESMKHLEKPAYAYYMKDGAEVQSSKDKFLSAPKEVQMYGVLEESYVLALERSQIPYPDKMTPKQSFMLALSKVCSSITSGWFREYAYENIFTAVKMYDDTYLDKFKRGVEAGVVKRLA